MPAHLWSDPGTWIALGISALFLVVGWLMHRIIRSVLQGADPSAQPPSTPSEPASATSPAPSAAPTSAPPPTKNRA